MKIVDMYGCGLPVCAVDYACIQELVDPQKTGYLFRTSDELSGLLRVNVQSDNNDDDLCYHELMKLASHVITCSCQYDRN